MFDQTKSSSLSGFHHEIQASFSIDWSSVTWVDLRKPLYSGIAARLYLQLKAGSVVIERSIEKQAEFWVDYYRPGEDKQTFIDLANRLEDGKLCGYF